VQSILGEGTCFSFELDMPSPQPDGAAERLGVLAEPYPRLTSNDAPLYFAY
jgi:hypothetical protein